MDEYIGIIKLFAGSFAPRGWAFCNGQIMNIAQYSALYSLLGTMYGGNGQTTFGLPNLQGRVPVGMGQGTGLPAITQGQMAGNATVTLLTTNLPPHTHSLMVNTANGTASSPAGGVPAISNFDDAGTGSNIVVNSYAAQANGMANPQAIAPTGAGQPVNVMPPYIGLNYIICLEGVYPSRS